MTLTLMSGPAVEPVDLSDAKLHLRVDHSSEDSLIDGLIAAARLRVEAYAGVAMIDQTWKWSVPAPTVRGAQLRLSLPLGPVELLTDLTVDGEALQQQVYVFEPGLRPRLSFTASAVRENASIEMIFDAGFGVSGATVPRDLRHAVSMLVAHWFEDRDPAVSDEQGLPAAVTAMLASYRKVRL